MTRLDIDGHPVALSPEFSLDFYDYNGIFDGEKDRGAFTYDIDIDLRQGDNARLYQHFNRINSTPEFTDRNARLLVDGMVLAQGKEVVLECDGNKAKIQIVCGNSEANAADDSKRLNALDLGTLPEYTQETALATIHAEPLSVPAVCTPVLTDYVKMPYVSKITEREETVGKMVNLTEYTDLWSERGSWHNTEDYPVKFLGQPYLVIVVERVLQALGWSVTYNILRSIEYARRLIVIHGMETSKICEMLPNWKASDFLYQIQMMFNVIIVYDNAKREAAIYTFGDFYKTKAITVEISPEEVVSDDSTPARKFDNDVEDKYNYDFVRYDLPSEAYGYRADISDNLKKIVKVWDADDFSEFNARNSWSRTTESFYNSAVFWRHRPSGTKWMLGNFGENIQQSIRHSFVRVDHFAHYESSNYKEGETSETVLQIVPAETLVMSIDMNNPTVNCGVVIPYAKNAGKVGLDFTTTKDMGLNQWVEGNEPRAKDTTGEKLYVAQYLGRVSVLATTHTNNTYNTALYPQVFTHRYIDGRIHAGQYLNEWEGNWRDSIFDALWDKSELEDDITFDLKKRKATTYSTELRVNDKEEHTINIKVRERLGVTSIFNIAGRRFVCRSLQYQVRNGKLLPYAIGKFLPLL